MTISGTSNATLLLVTGLFSASMAAISYYYLHMSSKKPGALTHEYSEADGYICQKKTTITTTTEEKQRAHVTSTATGIQVNGVETSSARASYVANKILAASVHEKTVAVEMPRLLPTSPEKTTLGSLQIVVEKVLEPSLKLIESRIAPEEMTEATSSPRKTSKSSPTMTSRKSTKEAESAGLALPKPLNTVLKKADKTFEKVVGSPKKNTIERALKETGAETIEQPEQASVIQTEILENCEENIVDLEKATELASATEALQSVTRKVSEDFVFAQAVTEPVSAYIAEKLQESCTSIALEQEEYIQVELTQSMTLQSIPDFTEIKDAVEKTIEDVQMSAVMEDNKGIVDREQSQAKEQELEQKESEKLEQAKEQELEQMEAKLKQKELKLKQKEAELGQTEAELEKAEKQEKEQMKDQKQAEEQEMIQRQAEEQKQAEELKQTEEQEKKQMEEQGQADDSEHVQVSFDSIKPASVVDTDVVTETLALHKSSYTTPVSWEEITSSPESKALCAEPPTTLLSLDVLAESTESSAPLLIDVPADNTNAPDQGIQNASDGVVSGGGSSTPGKRNRHRSKKSRSKKKKGKKH